MPMPTEGTTPPPEKSERELLLEELEEINAFLEQWGPLYLKLIDKGEDSREDVKDIAHEIHEENISDDRDEREINTLLAHFSESLGESRNIDSIKSEYIRNVGRKVEIEEQLRQMGENN